MRARDRIAITLAAVLGVAAAVLVTAPREPVPAGRTTGPDETALLPVAPGEGRRGVSIVADAAVGVAASVSPGDRVDVSLTSGSQWILSAVTIIQDVPVISAGETVGGEATADVVLRQVTLAVTGAEARKLAEARLQGWLSLSAPGEGPTIHDPRPPQRVVCPRLWPDDPDFPLKWPVSRRGCTESQVRHRAPHGAPGDL